MVEKYGKKTKKLMVSEMEKVFSENKGFVLSSVENIKASQMDKLRRQMRQSGSNYMVLKNSLAGIALKNAGIEGVTKEVEENKVLGIGIIKEDPVVITKLLAKFAKENNGFILSSGYLEGQVLTAERVKELADLPSRQQLLAMVVGMINSPISGFVGVLSAVVRSLVYALNAVKEKKEKN
ncbi:MAG: 50S ribosomal protein L10 [Candidatus Omnitrophota bacterium]